MSVAAKVLNACCQVVTRKTLSAVLEIARRIYHNPFCGPRWVISAFDFHRYPSQTSHHVLKAMQRSSQPSRPIEHPYRYTCGYNIAPFDSTVDLSAREITDYEAYSAAQALLLPAYSGATAINENERVSRNILGHSQATTFGSSFTVYDTSTGTNDGISSTNDGISSTDADAVTGDDDGLDLYNNGTRRVARIVEELYAVLNEDWCPDGEDPENLVCDVIRDKRS